MVEQRGSAKSDAEPGFLVIGQLIKPHGLRGEMRAAVYTQLPERFTWLEYVYMSRDPADLAPQRVAVRTVRFHQGSVLIRIGDYDTRDDLETLRGMWLMVPANEAIPLDKDEVFHHDLLGLEVFTDEGEQLGILSEVLETGANDVFVVHGSRGEVLLPNIPAVVQSVDLEKRTMVVHIIPGLLTE